MSFSSDMQERVFMRVNKLRFYSSARIMLIAVCVVTLPAKVTFAETVLNHPEYERYFPSKADPSVIDETEESKEWEVECSFHQINLEANDITTTDDDNYGYELEWKGGESQDLSCLWSLVAKVRDTCEAKPNGTGGLPCYVRAVSENFLPDWNGKKQHIGKHSNGAFCSSSLDTFGMEEKPDCPNPKKGKCDYCGAAQVLIDAETCQAVDPADTGGGVCFEYNLVYAQSCPVSLIWDSSVETENIRSIVKFPLSQRAGHKWTVWRGSSSTPILVYDPEHKGKIVSAEQLFGNWTFGGRRLASLFDGRRFSDVAGQSVEPWSNGYEALATLDRNFNGKIDGDELKSLALWFDENQDAKSQEGEVKSLQSLGVKALYYKPDYQEPNGDLHIRIGYERETEEGVVVAGASVDWLTETAEFAEQLLQKYVLQDFSKMSFQGIGTPDSQGGSQLIETDNLTASPLIEVQEAGFGGIWKWQMSENSRKGGVLIISPNDEGGVFGYSIVEHALAKSPSPRIKSALGVFALNGSQSADSEGRAILKFNSYSGSLRTESEARLSSDSKELIGRSTVYGVADHGKILNLTYKWRASRP